MHSTLKKIILFAGDILLLYLSLYIVLKSFYGYGRFPDPITVKEHFYSFTILFLLWAFVFYVWNLYNLEAIDYVNNYVKAVSINVIIAIVFFYADLFYRIAPKTNLFLIVFFFTIFFIVWRSVATYVLRLMRPYYRLVLVGMDDHMRELTRRLFDKRGSNYSLEAIINLRGAEIPQYLLDRNVRVESSLEALRGFVEKPVPVKIVVSDELYSTIFKELYAYLHNFVSFYSVASFWEEAEQAIPIYVSNEVWFLENLQNIHKRVFELVKRSSDFFFALLALPLVGIVYLLFGLAIKINSRGPIIFSQQRVGLNGRPFTLYKFRSMGWNAEAEGKPVWAQKNDPRITLVGNFLRKTRIDELPQILNVLKGEMSFIGPRPERPEFVEQLSRRIPHYELRHLVRPGLTGWAQINYEYASTEEETAIKLSYDLYYVKNRSALLDLKIAAKTLLVIFERKGR